MDTKPTYAVIRRRSLLLEACEKENEDLKGLVSSMKGELQASLRLQAEIQKSSSRLPRFSERPSRHEEYILDLEEEVRHWQDETEETRNELSDQLSENAALRKQVRMTPVV
jgi:predicted  nucleic acid-binding Zn-ribbon protein